MNIEIISDLIKRMPLRWFSYESKQNNVHKSLISKDNHEFDSQCDNHKLSKSAVQFPDLGVKNSMINFAVGCGQKQKTRDALVVYHPALFLCKFYHF